jgi:uncharacterized repeat protein (TIGR01451 family)
MVSKKVVVADVPPGAGASSPLLTLEKRGPADLQLGRPARFEIIVRNISSVPATQVRIEDTLPEGVRFLGGSPQPILEAGRVVWNVPQVLPGQEQSVYLEFQAMAPGDLATQTVLSHTMESRMQVRPGTIGLLVKAPGKAAVGRSVVFELQLVNAADQPASQLILNAQLSDGLMHPNGNRIESDPFDLPEHSSKSLTVTTTAVRPGQQSIAVAIMSRGRQEAVAREDVFVGEMSLAVRVPAITRIGPGKISDLAIEVENCDTRPARRVLVTSNLPRGLEFAGASDRGVRRGSSVQWLVDNLAPGQTRLLHVRVKTTSPADFLHVVSARAEDGTTAQAEGRVFADGAGQLGLAIAVKDNPLELGKETVFEIRLSNEGGAPDHNVQLRALLPEGMVPRLIEGLKYHLEGKQIVFDPIVRLDATKLLVVRIGALAVAGGDQRLRVQVMSDQLRVPLAREERTFVYADR